MSNINQEAKIENELAKIFKYTITNKKRTKDLILFNIGKFRELTHQEQLKQVKKLKEIIKTKDVEFDLVGEIPTEWTNIHRLILERKHLK